VDVVAVDWSGARSGASRHIWVARVHRGELVALDNGRSRGQVVEHLAALRQASPEGLAVGLDFAFSFPAWFLHQRGYGHVEALWEAAARDGEEWLQRCAPPFWGRPGKPRPELEAHYRATELQAAVAGIRAKSAFQIGGAGTVGTGSIRGMPHLLELRAHGFGIWPFHPPSAWTVTEIYPRLLTGPVRKSDPEQRRRHLAESPWSVDPAFERAMAGSEDAFDAAVSALAMAERSDELSGLPQACDELTLLEGAIWPPP
jgi:hypothetical protein